ncbi:MAG: energy-coupling factor transporter transmembrane component T [Chloroflexota bacterium]|nr:energy-coupling factor transporter transmembrane component T [Chloroflexota bacterium]
MAAILDMLETAKSDSPIHNLDPRAKALWWLLLIICPIVVTNPIILTALTLWLWLMAPIAGIGKKMYRLLITTYPVMVGFIVLTWPLFYSSQPDDHYLVNWLFIHISVEGIIYALAMGLRIVTALTACTFFVMVTDLMDLAGAMGELAQKVGISYTLPLMILSSFKFLPEVSGDFTTIQESFKSRAMELEQGNLWERMKKLAPVAIPLIDSTLRHANNIAIALELKAFGAAEKRTFYVQHRLCPRDMLFILTGVVALGICVFFRIIGLGGVEIFL